MMAPVLPKYELPEFVLHLPQQGPLLAPKEFSTHALAGHMQVVWKKDMRREVQVSCLAPRPPFFIGCVLHSSALAAAAGSGALDSFLHELTALYRDIYGREPWNEYLFCSTCRKAIGISTVYPGTGYTALENLEAPNSNSQADRACSQCGGSMKFFYDPELFLTRLRCAFRERIIAALLFDSSARLLGFSLGWETNVRESWRDKFLAGTGDQLTPLQLSYSEYLVEARQQIDPALLPRAKAFNSAEWAVVLPARKAGFSLPLYYAHTYAAFQAMSDRGVDVPVLGHSLLGSRALDIFLRIGFRVGREISGSRQVRVYSTLQTLLRGIAGLRPQA